MTAGEPAAHGEEHTRKRDSRDASVDQKGVPMLSILVCHSYFLHFDRKQEQRAKPYPPLATLQVVSLLRKAGHEVSLFDAMLARNLDRFEHQLDSVRPQVVVFYEDNYNFLSKMCLSRMRHATFEMLELARRCGARRWVAGSDASDAPAEYLKAGAEVVLHGEGLAALLHLIGRLDANPGLDTGSLASNLGEVSVAGSTAGHRTCTTPRLPAPPLAPLPAWDLVEIEQYRQVWRRAHGYFSLNMAASRGCSFRCNWCAKPIWGNQYLQRTARETAAEMLYLRRHFQVDHVWFADDIFGFKPDWVEQFAVALQEGGGGVPFTIQLRADLVSVRMAAALRLAGCREVWLGAESGSQRILDAMNKGTTLAQIHAARARLKAEGIRVGFFLQLGYLGEELPDILATRRLVQEARPDDVGVSVSYPLPGTPFYEQVRQQMGGKTNWLESSDLEMMFEGTYRSDFYRLLRDLLHDEVTQHGGVELARRWEDLVAREAEFRRDGAGLESTPALLLGATN